MKDNNIVKDYSDEITGAFFSFYFSTLKIHLFFSSTMKVLKRIDSFIVIPINSNDQTFSSNNTPTKFPFSNIFACVQVVRNFSCYSSFYI